MTTCEMCGKESGKADVTFDEGPIETETCLSICPFCQELIRDFIDGHKVARLSSPDAIIEGEMKEREQERKTG